MTISLTLVALTATLMNPAASQPEDAERRRVCLSPAESRVNVAAHQLRDPMPLLREAATQTRAEPLGTKLCRWNERFVYEMSLLRRDGRVVRIFVDAASGSRVTAQEK